MKLNIDPQLKEVSGSITVQSYIEAKKEILAGGVDEIELVNPDSYNKNYLIMDFIKSMVKKGYLVPPLITLTSKNKIIKKKFNKDLEELNNIWTTYSA